MKKAELVLIPSPGRGHIVAMVELAKTLVARDDRFLITVLITKFPFDPKLASYTDSLVVSSASDRIKFIDLSRGDLAIYEIKPLVFMDLFAENHKPHVRNAVTELDKSNKGPNSPRLAGFVVDLMMTTMIDVANEFQVPTYVFSPSSGGSLSLSLHLQALRDKRIEKNMDPIVLTKDSDAELAVPSFLNPVPIRVLPGAGFDEASAAIGLKNSRRIRQSRGVIVNTFMELESHALQFLLSDNESPPVYSVGPIVNTNDDSSQYISSGQYSDVIEWLDDQPPSSVVFLCFGSMGSFGGDQIKEIAYGLEQSGFRFLWSLRLPPPEYNIGLGIDYTDAKEVLPEGFLDRTAGRGKIISWAPQVTVLSHPAVGGFVSHCGWNSILESLWFGVPVATWPLFWEQQVNAFQMVRELGLAVEIRLDYRTGIYCEKEPKMVTAHEIEEGVRRLMEDISGNEVRKRVKEMSEKSRKALMDSGSSYSSLSRWISDLLDHLR